MSQLFAPRLTAFSPQEQQLKARAIAEQDPFWAQVSNATNSRVLAAAANTTWAGNAIGRFYSRTGFDADPNWELTQGKLDELMQGIDPAYKHWFMDAESEDQANAIRGQVYELSTARRTLAEAGYGGTIATVGASVLSPENVAITIGTLGLSAAGTAAASGARGGFIARAGMALGEGGAYAKAIKMGLVNAAQVAPVEAIVAGENPDVTARDAIASTAGAFGFGAASELTHGLTRAKRFIAGGAGQSIPQAAIEFGNEEQGTSQWALSTGMAFLMGGTFNAAGRAPNKLETEIDTGAKYATAYAAREVAREQGGTMTPDGVRVVDMAETRQAENIKAVQNTAIEIAPRGPEVGSGAAFAPGTGPLTPREVPFNDNLEASDFSVAGPKNPPTQPFGRSLFGLPINPKHLQLFMGELGARGPSEKARWVARVSGTDSLDPTVLSASAWTQGRKEGFAYHANNVASEFYGLHAKAVKASGGTPMTMEEFWTRAYDAREQLNDPSAVIDPVVKQAALASASADKPLYDLMQRHGVPGAEDFKHNASVTRHVWDRNALETMLSDREIGADGTEALLAGAIRKKLGTRNTDAGLFPAEEAADGAAKLDRLSTLLAKRLIKNAGTHNEDVALAENRLFSLDQRETLVQEAKALGINEEMIDSLVFALGPQKAKGEAAPFRERIPIDINHSQDFLVTDPATGQSVTRTVSVRDLLDRNWIRVHHRLINASVGQSALAEILRGYNHLFPREGGTPITSYAGLMGDIANDKGVFTLTDQAHQIDNQIARVELTMKGALGMPVHAAETPFGKRAVVAADALTRVTSASVMGNMRAPFQQLSELSRPLWAHAYELNEKAFMPEIAQIVNAIKGGETIDDGLIALAVEHGFGTSMVSGRPIPSVHDAEIGAVPGKLQHWSRQYARQVYIWTGQTQGQALIEQLSFLANANKLYQSVKSAKEWGVKTHRALADMGLSRQEADIIRAAMESHHQKSKGTRDFDVLTLADIRSWDDQRAASLAVRSITRAARRDAMKFDPSQQSTWMRHPAGKVLTSLRRFGVAAWGERTLWAGARMKDVHGWRPEVAFQMLFDSGFSTLMYALGVYAASLGRQDRKEYLEARLNKNELIKSTFGKVAWSSLVPMGVDSAISLYGGRPQFAGLRASGLGQDPGFMGIVTGVPIGSYLTELTGKGGRPSTPAIPLRAMLDSGYNFSQQDVRQILNGAFVPNVWYAKDGMNYLSSKYLTPRSKE